MTFHSLFNPFLFRSWALTLGEMHNTLVSRLSDAGLARLLLIYLIETSVGIVMAMGLLTCQGLLELHLLVYLLLLIGKNWMLAQILYRPQLLVPDLILDRVSKVNTILLGVF